MENKESTLDLITSGQVARLAGVSPTAVQQWIRGGKLRAARNNGAAIRLFSRVEVERFIEARAARRQDP
jgi:excisionase family DNA binding protein